MNNCESCGMAELERCAWVQEGHAPEDCPAVPRDVEGEARIVVQALRACTGRGDCSDCPMQLEPDCCSELLLRCLGLLRVLLEDEP